MRFRELNIGCFGGGTGLPSLLGGLKRNPWLKVHAVVRMFDSGGSSGQLRDELGVLPPGDVLKCAPALSPNEGEARRVLLARLPMLAGNAKLSGHTGGNLLLSMMEQYSGDFLGAVDALRTLLGRGRAGPGARGGADRVAAGDGLGGIAGGVDPGGVGGGGRPADQGRAGRAGGARAAAGDSPGGGGRDPRVRRRGVRARQVLREP